MSANSSSDLHKFCILVVDDDVVTLSTLARLLKSDGHHVYTADGYQTALEVAKREKIDLAVCDIALWDGDGCDLLNHLQTVQPMQAIAVTGFTLEDEVEHYCDAGFAAVLPKPLEHARLAAVISSIVETRKNFTVN